MSNFTVTKTRLIEGKWEGLINGPVSTEQPSIQVTHLEKPLQDVTIQPADSGQWLLEIIIPAETISDGVQTFVIKDTATEETLCSFSLVAGEALADDIRAEVDLLRAELDMLKRAFRRHCVETA